METNEDLMEKKILEMDLFYTMKEEIPSIKLS